MWIDIKDDIENSVIMLYVWKNSYLEVRARIESIRDHFIRRWEFNKQKLFSETDYISTVIEDIKSVLEVGLRIQLLFFSILFKKFTARPIKSHTSKTANFLL